MSTDVPLQVDPDQLPNDSGVLKSLVVQLIESLRERDRRIMQLEHHMDLLVRKVYGRSSEKTDPAQLSLFDKRPEEEVDQPVTTPPADEAVPSGKKRGHGRRPKPDTLQRRNVLHDLSDSEKQILAGEGILVLIGEEVTEQYEWEPSCLYVLRHVQKKYARRPALLESGESAAEKNIVTAPKPPQPIPGGIAGPGLLACLLTGRFCDHLSYHRHERIFQRHGLRFSRQTTCDLGASTGGSLPIALPADDRRSVGLGHAAFGRHARQCSRCSQKIAASGSILDLCRRQRSSVNGVRLHSRPLAQWADRVLAGLSRLPASRCL